MFSNDCYFCIPSAIINRNLKIYLMAGVILLMCWHTALSYRVCVNEDIPLMQTACKKENTGFSNANKHDNNTEICSNLYEMLFCVARSVPQCFQNYTFFYLSYMHSPHNCQPTEEQFSELQHVRKEALDKIDVVPLDSSTASMTDEVTYMTKSDEDGHVTDTSRKNGKTQHGGHSSHTGTNKGTHFYGNSVLVMFLVSIVTFIQCSNKIH